MFDDKYFMLSDGIVFIGVKVMLVNCMVEFRCRFGFDVYIVMFDIDCILIEFVVLIV